MPGSWLCPVPQLLARGRLAIPRLWQPAHGVLHFVRGCCHVAHEIVLGLIDAAALSMRGKTCVPAGDERRSPEPADASARCREIAEAHDHERSVKRRRAPSIIGHDGNIAVRLFKK